jgi:sugar-specific transcriptional regulator TrmB
MISELQYLGLSEKEAKVYELLASTEGLSAATIAKRTDIKRASVYEVLQGLEKKQLVSSYKKHGHMYFYIDTPEKLVLQYQTKLKLAESIVTTIKQKKKTQEVSLEVHKDRAGFKQLYREILLSHEKEFLTWSNFESFDRIIDAEEDEKWTQERVKNGTRPRLIMVDNPVSQKFQKEDKKYPRETLLIKAGENFSSSLVISGDTLYLFDDKPDVLAIKIQHPGFSTMIREVFETNWVNLKQKN